MKRSIWHSLVLAFLLSATALGTIGCSYSLPKEADYGKIENDPNMSSEQKVRLEDKMAQQTADAQYARLMIS